MVVHHQSTRHAVECSVGVWSNPARRCARGAGVDVGLGSTALEVIGGAAENTGHAPSGAYAFIDEIVCTHHRPDK